MKPTTLLLTTTLALTSASLFLPKQNPLSNTPALKSAAMPDSNANTGTSNAGTTSQPAVRLTDILGTHRSLTTFSSLSRLHESTSTLLSDLSTNTTVLAPLNSAIDSLPRKPWEDPREYSSFGTNAYEGDDGRERAQRNLRRFVEAHLVTMSPWEGKAMTVSGGEGGKGREIWWEERGGKRFVMPDDVEVEKVASKVANGEVWILKGVLNYV